MIPAQAVEAGRDITELRKKGIEYLSPEYWAYLQDRAGQK